MARLALGEDKSKKVMAAATAAYNHLHQRGSYKPEDLATEQPYQDLINATKEVFEPAITDAKMPAAMATYLRKDNHKFSGLKTHTQLTEAGQLLVNEHGLKRDFKSFEKEVQKLNPAYNKNYLEAEYQFATQSAQMAAKWTEYGEGGGRYNLQYRTAGDDKVRVSHRPLHNITLPPDNEFWSKYYPPNGWRCRCTVMEVRKSKYPESSSEDAMAAGATATTQLDKNGKNRLELFRFNPGKDKCLFPPANAYAKTVGAQQAVEAIGESDWKIERYVANLTDMNEVMTSHAQVNPENFARGFKKLDIETRSGNNGSTDMRGTIWLTRARTELVIEAMNNIREGKPTTFSQEDALSTLWHEIVHNKNKVGNMRLTTTQRRDMELANEFVSRKTLPDFIRSLGGELQNKELISNRESTGYNSMVRNYERIIAWCGADEKKVLESVSKHLIEERYDDQLKGLIKALEAHSQIKLKNIRALMGKARSYPTGYFEKMLESEGASFIKK